MSEDDQRREQIWIVQISLAKDSEDVVDPRAGSLAEEIFLPEAREIPFNGVARLPLLEQQLGI